MAVRRAGFTANERGEQGSLAWLRDEFEDAKQYPPNTWVGRLRLARASLLPVAQHLHRQNEIVKAAPKNGKGPDGVPLPSARQLAVRGFEKKAVEVVGQVDEVEREVAAKRKALKPFAKLEGSTFPRRAELRALFRTLSKEERRRALADDEVRCAVLEMPALASGMLPSDHAVLLREQLEREFPDDMRH